MDYWTRWAPRGVRLPAALAGGLMVTAVAVFGCNQSGLQLPAPPTRRPVAYLAQNARRQVDILFMVDNSNSMDAMQDELKNKFAQFFKPFEDLANRALDPSFADLNVGVVTSDFGAGASGAPGCGVSGPMGGGDQGHLQALGRKASPECAAPVGASFIHYVYSPDGRGRNNLPPGQDLLKTFTCMASVGSGGCGFEHQLESVYAALHSYIPENLGNATDPGFLRDEAMLVVVFLTNEDDASAPPDSDVFDKAKSLLYGFEDSYSRQTRFAVQCGTPPAFPPYGDSEGPLDSCIPAPNRPTGAGPGKQFDVGRYVNFFTSPFISGGVKVDPLDVVLVGIDAPDDNFGVILSNPGTPGGQPFPPCAQLNEGSNPPCVPVLQHSCVGTNPAFFGDPAVRINHVIRSARQNKITSICDDDYTPALAAAANQIASNLGGGCITDAFPRDGFGRLMLDCSVIDQTQTERGRTDTEVVECDATHSVIPCWAIGLKDACKTLSPDGLGLTIDRGADDSGKARPAPPHTTAIVSCLI